MTATEHGVWRDEPLSNLDALTLAIESRPRLRTTIAAIAICDGPLPARTLRHRVDRASRVIPRLRQRVVHDPRGLTAPMWRLDTDFELAAHLRTTRLGGGGTDRDLLDLAQELVVQPFDPARPLWEFTRIDGLADGRSALLLKSHHAVTDGVGGMRLMLELFDLEPDPLPDRHELPPLPRRRAAGGPGTGAAVRREAAQALRGLRDGLDIAATAISDPADAARLLGETLGSATRVLRPARTPLSPLMRRRSDGLELHRLRIPLRDLHEAGRRIGGTVNDAFVAAVALGTLDHHTAHGVDLDRLRVSIPIDNRAGHTSPGNHFTPGRVELEMRGAEADPMMRRVRAAVTRLRAEPAHALLGPLTGVMRRLPSAAAATVFDAVSGGLDIAASNVPGSPVPLHLCGREVTDLIPFGPLSGCASNVTLVSHAETAHVGVTVDPAAIPAGADFARRIGDGFTSVVKGS